MRRRQQSYRKNWVSSEQRQKFVEGWAPAFREWRKEFEAGRMSAPELCARVIDRTWRDLFPKSWANGERDCSLESVGFLQDFLKRRYRGLPEAVPLSLQAWTTGLYRLEVYFRELNVSEIMRLQSEGQRCVSLMIEPAEILNFEHEGRDFLSFIIHDLVHAHHLMKKGEDYRRQCEFSQVLAGFRERFAQHGIPLSKDHQERLDYIGADMNSHLIHLLKTLKALADEIAMREFTEALENEFRARELPLDLYLKLNSQAEDTELHVKLLQRWIVKEPDSSNFQNAKVAQSPSPSLSNSHAAF